jgi:hypothetical protein
LARKLVTYIPLRLGSQIAGNIAAAMATPAKKVAPPRDLQVLEMRSHRMFSFRKISFLGDEAFMFATDQYLAHWA